jgi:hypothetical protein
MACRVCGKNEHNVLRCPLAGQRIRFSTSIRKSKRCECCGQYGYSIERHHTRGRSDPSDYLDVCHDCHLECGHGGNWKNAPMKPRKCWVLGGDSYWRVVQ